MEAFFFSGGCEGEGKGVEGFQLFAFPLFLVLFFLLNARLKHTFRRVAVFVILLFQCQGCYRFL